MQPQHGGRLRPQPERRVGQEPQPVVEPGGEGCPRRRVGEGDRAGLRPLLRPCVGGRGCSRGCGWPAGVDVHSRHGRLAGVGAGREWVEGERPVCLLVALEELPLRGQVLVRLQQFGVIRAQPLARQPEPQLGECGAPRSLRDSSSSARSRPASSARALVGWDQYQRGCSPWRCRKCRRGRSLRLLGVSLRVVASS